MIDILLINPQPVVMKDLFAENLMYANPPLGLGYLASAARNAGYSVDLIDVGIDKLTISGIIHRIIEVDAQIVGISSFIANHGNGLKIAHEIKKQFGSQVKVMMGGPQASFVYEEVLKQGDVDIVSIFEGEQTIVELLNCIKTGGDLKKIAGIAFVNEEGEVIKTERRLPIQDLDTIDFPAWDLFKIDKYQEPGIVLTGRGCPYKCIFCSAGAIAGGRYRMRSVKNVVDEIEMLYKTYGIKKIFIADDTFTAIFMFGYRLHSDRANIQSAVTAVILLGVNVLVFYIYIKLADDLQLRRMTSVYEQQLDLCERHQQERELSILRLRDVRHNMKNNLVSILAYAENGDNEKIIRFVNEIMEEGGIKTSTVTNSGNIVIDSLIGYWYVEAKKVGIDFSVNLNIPMEMPFRGADICLILGNLLENAVEAAQKAEGKKYIRFHMKYDKNNLLLFVENNYKGVLIKTKDKRLKSTKTDAGNHGVGLSSVYRIAAKYHGVVTIDDDVANRFLIRVVLYGKQE